MEVLLDDEAHLDDLRAAFGVEVDEAGLRLDVLLERRVGVVARQVRVLVAEGRVRVDGRAVVAGSPRLQPGQRVVVLGERSRPELLPERIPLPILHEDADLLAIDKPAGMPVVPDRHHPAGTLANALRGLGCPLSSVEGPTRPGIVHRLDAGTSGVMVVAKTNAAHRWLVGLFVAHAITRRYLALVRGLPPWDTFTMDAPLGRRRAGRKAQAVRPDGRPALTHFRVLSRRPRPAGDLTLIEALPETGRTHQIRAHLAALGHPILGDTLYGGGTPASRPPLTRTPALHSSELQIRDALKFLSFSAPTPRIYWVEDYAT